MTKVPLGENGTGANPTECGTRGIKKKFFTDYRYTL
jgi:hypothetical protein